MVERVAPKKKAPPPAQTGDGPVRQGDPNSGYGKVQEVGCGSKGQFDVLSHLYYKAKRGTDCTVRRYFAGIFQIAYVREDRDGFTLWNIGPDPAAGTHFKKEADLHQFLRRMLME